MMGLIIGAIIGIAISSGFYRVPVEFMALIGALFGHLFARSSKASDKIEHLRAELKEAKGDINNLVLSKSKAPEELSPETSQSESENIEEGTKESAPSQSNIPEPVFQEMSEEKVPAPKETIAQPAYAAAVMTDNTSQTTKSVKISPEDRLDSPTSNPVEPAINYIIKFFTGDNAVLRVGIVILFLGVAFLLKYAAENVVFPMWLRLAGVSVIATVLLWLGWKLKDKRESYALAMQGAGVGILYLDIFGALKLTDLVPAGLAFFLLIFVCVFSAVLAIVQNSRSLATMGAIGGFLAPILASTGGGKYYLLFSYYLLLDAGILAIAWHKTWRSLNMVGFIFTFGIGLAWGVRDYKPEFFWNIELFLFAFFAMFVTISILFAIKQPENNKGYVDGSLVFGTPLLVFGLQTYLLKTLPNANEFALAFSALGLAVMYVFISQLFAKTKNKQYVLFTEATLALGVMFATLTIPLALNDGLWTSATWALEGSALLWVGIRQKRLAARAFGILLQFLAGASFLIHLFKIKIEIFSIFIHSAPISNIAEVAATVPMPVLNGFYMGCLTIFIAGMFASYLLTKSKEAISSTEYELASLMLVWSLLWWFVSGISEISHFADRAFVTNYAVIFIMLSCVGFIVLAKRLAWISLSSIVVLAPVTIVLGAIYSVIWMGSLTHPFDNMGYITWPVSFALFYMLYYVKDKIDPDSNTEMHHMVGYLTLFLILAFEVYWQLSKILVGTEWNDDTWLLFSIGAMLTMFMASTVFLSTRVDWPFKKHQLAYLVYSQRVVAAALLFWLAFSTLFSNANPAPLVYMPLLNPIELCQAFALLTLITWMHSLGKHKVVLTDENTKQWLPRLTAVVLFVWFNSMIVRSLAHWGGIPITYDAMIHSALAQATFSVVWTLMALVIMAYAARKEARGLWFGGGLILVLVVVKLFTVDLASIETLGRIISFMCVGSLLLLIGYLSPLPPKKEQKEIEVTE